MMNDNVHEIAPNPSFEIKNGLDELSLYSPMQAEDYRNAAVQAYDVAVGLMKRSVAFDSTIRIVLADFLDDNISVDGCWKLTESVQEVAPILDIRGGSIVKSQSYFMGFVLTKYGEILEFEKSSNAKNDLGLIHVADKHRGVYVRHGLLSRRCYTDKKIMDRIDDLSYLAGLRTY